MPAGALALVALSLLWLRSGSAALVVVACVPVVVVAPVLVFGGAALVVVACVPVVVVALVLVFLRSGSGCILHDFAEVRKMGSARIYTHTHTRAIIFRPAIFRLCTEIFSPEIFRWRTEIFRY